MGDDSPLSPGNGSDGPASSAGFSGFNAQIGVLRPAADIISISGELDCAYVGNRVILDHPGRDRLNVEVEPISAAISTGVLTIKTGISEGSKGTSPNSATTITSTATTQKQSGLDVTAQGASWVEVTTAQAGLMVKVRLTAMKS